MIASPRRGFTLIELLAVISIVILLVSLILPVLKRGRAAARGTQCLSNLRSMGTGWLTGMYDAELIPHTRNPAAGYNWFNLLDQVFQDVPNLFDAATQGVAEYRSFNACPQVQSVYHPTYYAQTQTWGYAVNTAWEDLPNDDNSLQRWSAIRRPSAYPWFMDGELESFADGYNMTFRAPRQRTATKWLTWGVGTHHNNGGAVNVWFAGGNARMVDFGEIDANVAGGGSYRWFENR